MSGSCEIGYEEESGDCLAKLSMRCAGGFIRKNSAAVGDFKKGGNKNGFIQVF